MTDDIQKHLSAIREITLKGRELHEFSIELQNRMQLRQKIQTDLIISITALILIILLPGIHFLNHSETTCKTAYINFTKAFSDDTPGNISTYYAPDFFLEYPISEHDFSSAIDSFFKRYNNIRYDVANTVVIVHNNKAVVESDYAIYGMLPDTIEPQMLQQGHERVYYVKVDGSWKIR